MKNGHKRSDPVSDGLPATVRKSGSVGSALLLRGYHSLLREHGGNNDVRPNKDGERGKGIVASVRALTKHCGKCSLGLLIDPIPR